MAYYKCVEQLDHVRIQTKKKPNVRVEPCIDWWKLTIGSSLQVRKSVENNHGCLDAKSSVFHTHTHPTNFPVMATRVYIGRLARDARERDLERLFKGYGDIREINLKNGYGFVEFKDPRDAEDVVYDFHGKDFLGER